MKKQSNNIQEFIKNYLFERDLNLLEQGSRIDKLNKDFNTLKESVKEMQKRFPRYDCPGICLECYTIPKDDLYPNYSQICDTCNKFVCFQCSRTKGIGYRQLGDLFSSWECDECISKK